MSVSIRVCPSCSRLLLEDTVQCPECHHVLDSERASDAPPKGVPTPEDATSDHDPCPKCGEEVRRGLVRCWNCGTFMRQDMAKLYQQMQASPREPILSSIDPDDDNEDQARTSTQVDDREIADDDTFELGARDEDFTLGSDMGAVEDLDEEDFDVDVPRAPTAESDPGGAQPVEDVAADSPPPVEDVAESPDDPAAEPGMAGHSEPGETGLPHSVATGGDVLLQVALEEEAEQKRRRSAETSRRGGPVTPKTGFLVYCPHGHRIEVQERHRGMTGRCPKCRETFLVPAKAWQDEALAAGAAPSPASLAAASPSLAASGRIASGTYSRWIADAHFHQVDPARLKLTPGSLQKDFQAADIGFSPSGILIAVLLKKGGFFGGGDKNKEPTRAAMFQHLEEEKPLNELPVAERYEYDADQVREIRVVQPASSEHESMFAGVPVFGAGQIAVRLPKTADGNAMRFLSFMLSGFREFAADLEDLYLAGGLGRESGVPLTDEFTEYACHYSDEKLPALEHVEFYQADPAYTLKIIGRRCQECGLIVSEESRKKEKIGNASGTNIAKAVCPKCKKKFGDISLYSIEKGPGNEPEDVQKDVAASAEASESQPPGVGGPEPPREA